jgi:ComEC/Rec2-related protein
MVWFVLALLAAVGAGMTRRRVCAGLLLASVFLVGVGWWSLRITEGAERLARTLPPEAREPTGALVTLRGLVIEPPTMLEPSRFLPIPGEPDHTMTVRVLSSGEGVGDAETPHANPASIAAGTKIRMRVTRGATLSVRAGDRVRCVVRLHTIDGPLNPGEFDARLRAAQDRVLGRGVTSAALVETLDGSGSLVLAMESAFLRARWELRARALHVLGGDPGGSGPGQTNQGLSLVRSLLLGQDERALEPSRDAFTRVGLSHILAISGFHLVVLVWSFTIVLRAIRDFGALEPLLVALLILGYLLILPVEAPIVRAGVMALAFLLADALGRRHQRLAILGWVAILLLLARPADALSLGFQLSVGLTALLIGCGARVHERVWGVTLRGQLRMRDPTLGSWALEQGKGLVSTSLLCWLVSLPIIAFHTGSVSLLAVPATVVVVPLSVVLMWIGFVTLLGGMLFAPVSSLLLPVLDVVASVNLGAVHWFDESRFSLIRVAPFSPILAAGACGLSLWWAHSGRWRSVAHWLATLLLLSWGAMEVSRATALGPSVLIRVDTLAVGDGSCHIIRSGGEAMLWDCGSLARGDVGSRLLPRAARALGVMSIRTGVLTHPNLDHANGFLDAARTMGLRTLLVEEGTLSHARANPGGYLAEALAGLRARGVEIRLVGAGDAFVLGDADVRFLWPRPGFESREPNERSLVALIAARAGDHAGERRSVLMTGDVQGEAIAGLRASYPTLRPGVLEMPHHGSYITEAVEFVLALDPPSVHQSTGMRRATDPRWEAVRTGSASPAGGTGNASETWWGVTAVDGALFSEIRADGSLRHGSHRHGSHRHGSPQRHPDP